MTESVRTSAEPMRSIPIIRCENLSLSLKGPEGEVAILKEIEFTVNAAEKVSIMGPSGSGKTSLLLVMAGLERATGGTVRIDGADITSMSEDELAVFRRRSIGIVFQNFHLIPTMTALENIAMPLELAGVRDALPEARAALDAVGLSHRGAHFPAQLSGGEQQRVALARAFVMRPKILLADEPTGNLDQKNGEQIVAQMLELHRRYQTTLLLVTHDRGLAETCDRIVFIRDGRIACA